MSDNQEYVIETFTGTAKTLTIDPSLCPECLHDKIAHAMHQIREYEGKKLLSVKLLSLDCAYCDCSISQD